MTNDAKLGLTADTISSITYAEAAVIEKTLVSEINIGPPNTGIMGAHMIATYRTLNGQVLVHEWGNGWGEWFFKTPS